MSWSALSIQATNRRLPMNRREWLKWSTASVGAAGLPLTAAAAQGQFPGPGGAGPQAAAQGRNLPPLRITDIRTILTAPARIRLVVVKVMTSEPGLYGL